MKYLLTLDVGTTAVKVGIISQVLDPLVFIVKEYMLFSPEKGIVELNPEVYWKSATEAIKEALASAGIKGSEIAAITCTTQGETIIPVDIEGNPLYNAIVWLDSRAKEEADYISGEYTNADFYKVTGVPEISPLCPIAKILWFKNKKPEIYNSTYKFLLLEDYLVMKLTGRFVSNAAIMCTTGYFDIILNVLWEDMLAYCGIDQHKFCEVLPSGVKAGELTKHAAVETGLPEGIFVATGAMDQVASAIGSGNIKDGIVTETTGTAQVTAATCGIPDLSRWTPVTIYSHAIKDKYLLINISQTAGIILKWFRDEFCRDIVEKEESVFAQMDEIAEGIAPLSNGLLLFPHFTGMQIPRMDPNTRGVFFGIGLDTGRGHFIRSIMEAVGYMLRENIEALEELGVRPKSIYSLGGASKSKIWSRIKADICDMEIFLMDREESTSIGAAILGGVACGLISDVESACRLLGVKGSIKPVQENTIIYNEGYKRYKNLYDCFKELF